MGHKKKVWKARNTDMKETEKNNDKGKKKKGGIDRQRQQGEHFTVS